MTLNLRGALRSLIRGSIIVLEVVIYAVIVTAGYVAVESTIASDHIPFNIVKFILGLLIAASPPTLFYYLTGKEIGTDRASEGGSRIYLGFLAIYLFLGLLSLTYWSQYVDSAYFTWTSLGIYSGVGFATILRRYR